jgi:hypothetical protein
MVKVAILSCRHEVAVDVEDVKELQVFHCPKCGCGRPAYWWREVARECICHESNSQDYCRLNEDGTMEWTRNGESWTCEAFHARRIKQ